MELLRVSAGADIIGYVYNLVYRGHVYAYQTGILYESNPRLKPGLVSHCLCIERHLEEGSDVYDFMAGDARYKASLGEPGPDMALPAGGAAHLAAAYREYLARREAAAGRTRTQTARLIRCRVLRASPRSVSIRSKYAIVRVSPSSSATRGSQLSVLRASVMSGQRCSGSSCGSS